jgi:hypothetical protein
MKYQPSPARKKEITKFKTAASRWYLMDYAKGDPVAPTGVAYAPWAKKANQKQKDLVLYAAALGIKQSLLPVDLEGWVGNAVWEGDAGSVKFRKAGTTTVATVPVRFLEWTPTPPVSEPVFEMQLAA